MQNQCTLFRILKQNWCSEEVKRDIPTRHTGSRNSLEDPNSNSAKIKHAVKKLLRENLQGNQKYIIMYYETFHKLDFLALPGQQFYTIPKGTKPDVLLKAIKTKRFGKKVIVWQ